ncbi:phage tail tape measure protein [Eubacterium multiforme]|uniref:TP901 family phage tail tape measure protein n=1 Tax=Eubacterium multiforme TaxID=83339 RepID=A0ABT9UWC6_9FIRM|nr:phage tail tape measure protein [Eubacterium multiforme]MDQ0150564.1 TP901 family phage tail tape measure protein [Eubacterium multiforme]
MASGIELAPLVVAVNGDVDNFNKSMDKVEERGEQTASKASNKLGNIGKSLTNIGDKLTTHVSVPLAAVGAVGIKVGMDFESQMSRVKAISGATGDQFKELEDQALSLGQSTAFSAKEVAEGMENLASAGFNTKEIMEAMPGLLDLAASSGEDLATSSDIAASTLRGFGLEASQAGHVADVLAKNAGATNAAVKDTGDAMKYIAPVAHTMGLSLEQVTAAIGEMANAGIKGSQAGTTLRAALVRLTKPSDPAISAMKSIGFTAFDSSGKMKDLSTIVEELSVKTKGLTQEQKQNKIATIFGTEALSGMMVLMDNGKAGLDDLTNSYKDCDGAAKEMAETMQDNTKASIEQAGGALETASIKMLKVVAPAIKEVAEDVGNLADEFSALDPHTQEIILTLGGIAIAAGPVLSIAGKGITLCTTLAPLVAGTATATAGAGVAAGGAAVGVGALSAVALPLIGIIAAVAGGIYLFTKNSETMNGSCLRSKEDLGLVDNALLNLNGSYALTAAEMDKFNIKHKDWNSKVAPDTAKELDKVANRIANFNFELAHSNGLDGLISKKDGAKLNKRLDEIVNDAIKKIKSRSPEVQKEMAECFKADDGKLDENEKKINDFLKHSQDKQIKEVEKYHKEILKIQENARKKKRDLSEDELKEIEELTKKIGNVAAENTAKSQSEMLAAQATFNAKMNSLDMKGVSSLLKEKAQARDKEIKIDTEKYDKKIELLKLYKPKMSKEEQKAADEEIKKLEGLKQKSIKTKNSQYNGYLEAALKKYPELARYINAKNGEILTSEEQAKQTSLLNYSKKMEKLNGITKTGYYQIKDTTDGSMHDCYVSVDEATGQINGVWDKTTDSIYGNPVKAREAIDKGLKDGTKFKPIKDSYDEKKDAIWNNAIKVACEHTAGLFDWVTRNWDDTIGYVLNHPIKAFADFATRNNGAASSHYNGLDNVPFDGYLARLHKGERVLTADENANYNKGNGDINVTQNIYADTASPYEIAKATKRSIRELQFT